MNQKSNKQTLSAAQIETSRKIAQSLCTTYDGKFLIEKAKVFFKNRETIGLSITHKLCVSYGESKFMNFKIFHCVGRIENNGSHNLSFGFGVCNSKQTVFDILNATTISRFTTIEVTPSDLKLFESFVKGETFTVEEFSSRMKKAVVTMANKIDDTMKQTLPITANIYPAFDINKVPDELITPWAKAICKESLRDFDFFKYFPECTMLKPLSNNKSVQEICTSSVEKTLVVLKINQNENVVSTYFGILENKFSEAKPGFKFTGYRKVYNVRTKVGSILENVESLSFQFATRQVAVYDIEEFTSESNSYFRQATCVQHPAVEKPVAKSIEVAPKVQSVDNSTIQSYLRTLVANSEKENMRRASYDKEIRDILKETLKVQEETRALVEKFVECLTGEPKTAQKTETSSEK